MGSSQAGRHFAAKASDRRAWTALLAAIAVAAAALGILAPSPSASAGDLGESIMFITEAPTTILYGERPTIYGTMADSSQSCNGPGQDCDNPTGQAYITDDLGDGLEHVVGAADVVPIQFTHKRSTFAITLNTLGLGVHSLQVFYTGNFRSPDQAFPLTINVVKNTCTVTFTQSSPVSKPGENVTFTATLSGTGNIDTGNIVFEDVSGRIADIPLVNRQASFSTTSLDNGTTHINAGWSGLPTNNGCFAELDHFVDAAPPPVAVDESVVTDFQTPVLFSPLANDYSNNGGPVRLEFQDSPQNGDLENNGDGTYTYTPFDDFVGEDDVHYVVYDTTGQGSNEAHTHFVVGCIAEAFSDDYTTDFATPLEVTGAGILANDRNCDETVSVQTPPAHGALVFDGAGGFTYTPEEFWAGHDSFTYGYDDEFASSATVTILTNSLPVPPPTTTTTTTTEPTTTTTEATTTTTTESSTTTTEPTTTTSSTTTTTIEGSTTTTTEPTTVTTTSTTTTAPSTTSTTAPPTTTTTTTAPPTTTTTTSAPTSTTTRPTTTTTTRPPTTTTRPTTTTTSGPPTGTTLPPTPPATAVTPPTAAEALVGSIYRDLLGRAPGAASLAYWSGRLDDGASPRRVIGAILGSAEYRRLIVTRTYLMVLGRTPSARALAAWTDRLAAGASVDDLRAYLLGSDEYWTKAGGTTAAFVDALYRQVLGRAPDAGGRAFVEALLRGGQGRAEVARWLLATSEADRHLADTWYRMLLDRPATTAEGTHWATALHAGATEAALIADLLASAEYRTGG